MDKKARVMLIGSLFLIGILLASFVIARPNPKARKLCWDGIDNDGDSYIDWPDDPGCSSKNDRSELNPDIECDDGVDNDGDGAIDMNDVGCSTLTDNDETDCGDGICEGGETQETCIEDCAYQDSCSDTDGGNVITIFGTTSGYLNNSYYSHDDYCVGSENIMEYYCIGDYEQSQQQSCGTDTYGQTYCMNSSVYRDYIDYFCSSGECSSSAIPQFVEYCEYGCTNGDCNLEFPDSCFDSDGGFAPEIQGTVSGYLNGQKYSDTDFCLDNTTLNEYYCFGAHANSFNVNCAGNMSATCYNGACVVF